MNPTLAKWSWQDIQKVYATLGAQYTEFNRIKATFGLEELKLNINYPDLKNIFIIRALRDIKRLDLQIAALDKEIARRNKLLGVMG